MSDRAVTCRYCATQIASEEDGCCVDRAACAKRVARRARKTMASMVTKPFVGFDPDKAYRQAMGRGE